MNGRVPAAAGSVARIFTGGGGGWGPPLERPVQELAEDLRRGYVSPEAATTVYGLVLGATGQPDPEATERRRAELVAEAQQ